MHTLRHIVKGQYYNLKQLLQSRLTNIVWAGRGKECLLCDSPGSWVAKRGGAGEWGAKILIWGRNKLNENQYQVCFMIDRHQLRSRDDGTSHYAINTRPAWYTVVAQTFPPYPGTLAAVYCNHDNTHPWINFRDKFLETMPLEAHATEILVRLWKELLIAQRAFHRRIATCIIITGDHSNGTHGTLKNIPYQCICFDCFTCNIWFWSYLL